MKRMGVWFVGVAAMGMLLTGCGAAETAPAESAPVAEAQPTPTQEAAAEPAGTRQNPVPFGEAYTFEDIGEAGGPAWKVTIDQPRDMSAEILAAAVEKYGDDESYLAPSRPEAGTTFVGYTGTLERLLDTPMAPGYDLELAVVGSDGNTYNAIAFGVGGPEENIVNIAEMYAPATARFSDVQVVPEGVTAGQVLVTMRNTGERIYFGTPPAS